MNRKASRSSATKTWQRCTTTNVSSSRALQLATRSRTSLVKTGTISADGSGLRSLSCLLGLSGCLADVSRSKWSTLWSPTMLSHLWSPLFLPKRRHWKRRLYSCLVRCSTKRYFLLFSSRPLSTTQYSATFQDISYCSFKCSRDTSMMTNWLSKIS